MYRERQNERGKWMRNKGGGDSRHLGKQALLLVGEGRETGDEGEESNIRG